MAGEPCALDVVTNVTPLACEEGDAVSRFGPHLRIDRRGYSMKKQIVAILLSLMVASPVFAQIVPNDAKAARIAATIDAGGPLYRSAVREAEGMAQARANESQQQQQKRRIRHPALVGAAIGAGAGFLITAPCRTGESWCSTPGKVLMTGIGAGFGAAVGVLVSR